MLFVAGSGSVGSEQLAEKEGGKSVGEKGALL